jgi:hypothetical protein
MGLLLPATLLLAALRTTEDTLENEEPKAAIDPVSEHP